MYYLDGFRSFLICQQFSGMHRAVYKNHSL